jgi:type VI secretion system ImpM family protein
VNAFVAGPAGLVGKLPTRAEYLPVPTTAPSFAAFDGFLSEAMEWALGRAGSAFPDAFTHGAMHGFVFRPPGAGDQVLCGALTPSQDSAGRQFPLALGAPLRLAADLVASPQLLPFTLEGIWGEATQLLADCREGAGQGSANLSGVPDTDVVEAAQLFGDWTAQLPLIELWNLLGPALVNPAGTVRLLFETLAPVRGVERPDTTLSLRLPLGLVGGAALCFWLDVVRRYAGWRSTVPSLFWSHDGTTGAVLLNLGRPPKSSLAELWLPSGQRDEIADLTVPPDPALLEALSPLPAQLPPLLGARDASAAHLLHALST